MLSIVLAIGLRSIICKVDQKMAAAVIYLLIASKMLHCFSLAFQKGFTYWNLAKYA